MGKIFRNLIILILVILISVVVGMISPGQWLSQQKRHAEKLYYRTFRFRETPVAENFLTEPFELSVIYVENTEGHLETYLVNSSKNEMLPILEIEGTTQVGDAAHRFKGLGEEGRNSLKNILEDVKGESSGALERMLELLGK